MTYSCLDKKHVKFVREEIKVRGGIYDRKDGVRKLSKILKEIEIDLQKKHILETTGNPSPNNSQLNKKTFFPLCRSADKYELY